MKLSTVATLYQSVQHIEVLPSSGGRRASLSAALRDCFGE